jgi:regulator of replication initiation timing
VTEEELDHLYRQLPSLPVGWEMPVADLIAEVRRLKAEGERLRMALAEQAAETMKVMGQRDRAREGVAG